VGVPEIVNAFVRSKARAIEQDVKKLRIVQDPKIHCDLLRLCQHTRLAFLARNVPPDTMMRPADVKFDPGRGDWGSGIIQGYGIVPVPVLIQDSIVQAILQRGLRVTFNTLSAHELAWCGVIVELPHHKGGLGITPLPASEMAAFYSAIAQLVSWLSSLPHASEWVAGQNLADPNTWNSSALQTLKQFHDKLLTHYNCTERVPPPVADAHAQGRDYDIARPLSLPPLNLLASLRVQQDEDNVDVAARPSLPPQRQVTKHIASSKTPNPFSPSPASINSPLVKCGCKNHSSLQKHPIPYPHSHLGVESSKVTSNPRKESSKTIISSTRVPNVMMCL
jgi:hypothetical protein